MVAHDTTVKNAPRKRVEVTVNGKLVKAFDDMSIAAAAAMADSTVPTLCFFWGLNDCGGCRVCSVEIEDEDQLVASCNNKVREGMVITTNSPKVHAARKLNVELLLSQHKVQCTNCVRGGTCELRKLANDLNIVDTRFTKHTERNAWKQDFPLIRDADKCVKCWRCVQVCDKIQATHVWGRKNRATRTTIGVTGGLPIEESLCTLCGQCITYCPTGALRERDDVDRVLAALKDPDILTVIQIAPSVRTSWGEAFGLTPDSATVKRLVAALRALGIDYIFDTDFSADLTIIEEGNEFVKRFTEKDAHPWPMFTSCCPGWMRWVKGHHPDLIDNLSTAKSPQQMFGAVMKSYFAELQNLNPKRIYSISVMPCLAKKHECALPSMNDAGSGPDVDTVLTVRELTRLIRSEFIDVTKLDEEEFDTPFGIGSGAGEIFGATGGVMEAALRSAYFLITGNNPDPDAFAEVRGLDGWKEATFDLCGTSVRVAVASGLANTEKLIAALAAGEVSYDFVEIMACPGGCIGGGGQPINTKQNTRQARSKVLYGLDRHNVYRFSHENPSITQLYEDYLGEALSEKAHHLLHTDHRDWSMPHEGKQEE